MFPGRLQHQTQVPTFRCLHHVSWCLRFPYNWQRSSHRSPQSNPANQKCGWAALGSLGSAAERLSWVAQMVDVWCRVGLQTPEQGWQTWHKSFREPSALCSHSLRASLLAWGTTPPTAVGALTPSSHGDSHDDSLGFQFINMKKALMN